MTDPIAFAFGMLAYILIGAVLGGVSAFCLDTEWMRWGRRCPTYGEFGGRVILGLLAGVPVFLLGLVVVGGCWFFDRPRVKTFFSKPMCRLNH